MRPGGPCSGDLSPQTEALYRHAIASVCTAGVPFLIGGGYALAHYTQVARHTKDVDFLVRPRDRERAFEALSAAGCHVEGVFHWVGKAYCGEDCVDVISGGANGVGTVDDEWFAHAVATEVVGVPVQMVAPEELIWAKAFVMERERYDGADVAHLLQACAQDLDWRRLLDRFGPHWRMLLSHLVLFGFIYPWERSKVPAWVMRELIGRLQDEMSSPPPTERVCQGTLLSWRQYLPDLEQRGYRDARIELGYMTKDEVDRWTEAFRDT